MSPINKLYVVMLILCFILLYFNIESENKAIKNMPTESSSTPVIIGESGYPDGSEEKVQRSIPSPDVEVEKQSSGIKTSVPVSESGESLIVDKNCHVWDCDLAFKFPKKIETLEVEKSEQELFQIKEARKRLSPHDVKDAHEWIMKRNDQKLRDMFNPDIPLDSPKTMHKCGSFVGEEFHKCISDLIQEETLEYERLLKETPVP